MSHLLIAGGAGFIGKHFLDEVLKSANSVFSKIHVIDKLTYSSDGQYIQKKVAEGQISFSKADISDWDQLRSCFGQPDSVINFAAETHVDNSIKTPGIFAESNYLGVSNLLSLSVERGVSRFLQVSTDEVYGSIQSGEANEEHALNPSSPYSASKAAADLLVDAFRVTFDLNTVITRTCNNFGPGQHPEKLIPKAVEAILAGRKVPIYGSGTQIREWIHVEDNCRAILRVLTDHSLNGVVNVGSGFRVTNEDLIRDLIGSLGAGEIEYVSDRPGHDSRYAVDSSKIQRLHGFQPKLELSDYFATLKDLSEANHEGK